MSECVRQSLRRLTQMIIRESEGINGSWASGVWAWQPHTALQCHMLLALFSNAPDTNVDAKNQWPENGRACAKSAMPSQHSLCQKPHHRGKLIIGNGYIPSANTRRWNAICERATEPWPTNQWTFLQLFCCDDDTYTNYRLHIMKISHKEM